MSSGLFLTLLSTFCCADLTLRQILCTQLSLPLQSSFFLVWNQAVREISHQFQQKSQNCISLARLSSHAYVWIHWLVCLKSYHLSLPQSWKPHRTAGEQWLSKWKIEVKTWGGNRCPTLDLRPPLAWSGAGGRNRMERNNWLSSWRLRRRDMMVRAGVGNQIPGQRNQGRVEGRAVPAP